MLSALPRHTFYCFGLKVFRAALSFMLISSLSTIKRVESLMANFILTRYENVISDSRDDCRFRWILVWLLGKCKNLMLQNLVFKNIISLISIQFLSRHCLAARPNFHEKCHAPLNSENMQNMTIIRRIYKI